MEEFKKDAIAVEFKNTIEEGAILHILQYTNKGKCKYEIDLSFDAFKQLVNLGFDLVLKHPILNNVL